MKGRLDGWLAAPNFDVNKSLASDSKTENAKEADAWTRKDLILALGHLVYSLSSPAN